MTDEIDVPFRITDINLKFLEAEGRICFRKNRVVFVYLVRDALGMRVKADERELHLGLDDLSSLEIRDWWVTLRLVLDVRSVHAVRDLPNSHSGQLVLKVSRRHRESLREFVTATRYALSARRLVQAGAGTAKNGKAATASFP